MSDFPARAFKWTEIISYILITGKSKNRNKTEDLDQLAQYARKRYKATNPIEERLAEYFKDNLEMYEILVLMFGEP